MHELQIPALQSCISLSNFQAPTSEIQLSKCNPGKRVTQLSRCNPGKRVTQLSRCNPGKHVTQLSKCNPGKRVTQLSRCNPGKLGRQSWLSCDAFLHQEEALGAELRCMLTHPSQKEWSRQSAWPCSPHFSQPCFPPIHKDSFYE
ncbi:hypothetical protein mRhiFer1_008595 [Rhinolophus ferrumequinum]|uniref:Uncharacterized protein n=1 Tax=Rhinolophus ferrumequinum TaxID=59479 RepID=A0A7J7UJT7_RHIFE|nr:hypothetical protein mRhiFer1_008595 [Rhinolophus ferrumequinum]